jgi:hypothetical protein
MVLFLLIILGPILARSAHLRKDVWCDFTPFPKAQSLDAQVFQNRFVPKKQSGNLLVFSHHFIDLGNTIIMA